jgi:hypothetical protein
VTLQSSSLLAGPLDYSVTGNISGAFAIQKAGGNKVTLGGVGGTYSGGTQILNGVLSSGSVLTGSGAAGPFGTGTITILPATTLDLNGSTIANAITMNGAGVNGNGALINTSATAATETGAITIASNSAFGGTGAMTTSGVISAGANTVSFVNGADVTAQATRCQPSPSPTVT